MTYEEALSYLHATPRFGARPGLERIRALLVRMGNPERGMRFIHVAGTNGKGSTCAAIASVLTAAGYRTGLYTSPYLEDFRERMRVDGRLIPREELAELTANVRGFAEQNAREGLPLTEFELCTAIAFAYFRRERCDAVVLEVGLGGRFDATNVLEDSLVSVICPVSLDHTRVLGDTVEKIAFEKCGIIKRGGLVVSSPQQQDGALAVILERCAEENATLLLPNANRVRVVRESIRGSVIEYGGHTLPVPLAGRHQHGNFITAWETLEALRTRRGMAIPEEAVERGFGAVRFPARLEVLRERPLVLLDGAHNPAGAETLAGAVERFLPGKRLAVVLGIFADKDFRAVIGRIAPLAGAFFTVAPPGPRALPAEEAARVAAESCKNAAACESPAEAYRRALDFAGEDGAVVVCGSLCLAGAMRPLIRKMDNFS